MGAGAVALVAAAALGAGATAYSASQVPDAPDPINYGQQYRDILRAQLRNAGRLYGAHAEYDPLYAGLDERLLLQRLLGSEGGDRTEEYTDYVTTPGHWEIPPAGPVSSNSPATARGSTSAGRIWIPGSSHPVTRTRTVTDPATRGLIDITERDLQPAQRRMQTEDTRARVQGEVDILREMGPEAIAALKASNPSAAALIDELTRQASEELQLGGNLSRDQRRQVSETVRQGQADRGMGFSPSDVFIEALQTADASEALKASRRSFAANTAQLNAGFAGDAYQRFFGRSSGSTASAGEFVPYGASGSRAPFNPESSMAQDIIGTNFNVAQDAFQAGQNNLNSTIGSSVGNFGNALATYLRSRSNPGLNTQPGNPTLYSANRQTGLQMGALGYGGGV